MKNVKNKILLATAIIALASCSENTYLGPEGANGADGAISFSSGTGKSTRATSNTASTDQEKLDNQFLVYGVKNVKDGENNVYSSVFNNYVVFYNNTPMTASNPDADWEYVGASTQGYGSGSATLGKEQTIKYWDQAAANYHFVAGSPVSSFTFNLSSNDISTAKVTGFAGHIGPNSTTTPITTNPVYIAKPVNVPKTSSDEIHFGNEVPFNFVRQQSFVRVGIYETIPGYKITEIKFYPYNESSDGWGTTSCNNIILATNVSNFFVGGKDDEVEGTVTYHWNTTPASYTFTYSAASGKTLTQQNSWYGGAYNYTAVSPNDAWEMATSSAETDKDKLFGKESDRGTDGYFIVLPTPSATTETQLKIKCDYKLTSNDGSNEVINVKGAEAAIPAKYSLWKPNYKYTYLFKITDNKLTPITFDAAVIEDEEGNQETITTVDNPSITTYAKASNVTVNNEYLTNATSPINIYIVVGDGIALNTSNAKLYTVTLEDTDENDAITTPVQPICESSVANVIENGGSSSPYSLTDANKFKMTVTSSSGLTTGVTQIPATDSPTGANLAINCARFAPAAAGYYAFEYTDGSDVKHYKVIKVVVAP